MSQLTWDTIGERFYETGVDRGVLYPVSGPGVAWNGLISVTEKNSSDAPTAYYFDGVKYVNVPASTEFEATLEAYTYPNEFEKCDGTASLMDGVLVGNQNREQFGLCYRTRVGDDLVGTDRGYKLHLVYNALATPSDKAYLTQSTTPSAIRFQWDISTTPVAIQQMKPSAHLVIDSRRVSSFGIMMLERVLYGAVTEPRLPSPSEVVDILSATRMLVVIDSPDESLLPPDAEEGDLVFAKSNDGVYSIGDTPSGITRPVIVISGNSVDLLPETAYPGDLVYDETTGIIYRLGE